MRSSRRWPGLAVEFLRAPAGRVETPGASRYVVSMLVGNPVRAVWRSDAGSRSALRVAGDIDVVCPRSPVVVEHDRPTKLLNVSLSDDLVASTAVRVGTNTETLASATRTQVRDPRLQHIVWALTEEVKSKERYDETFAEAMGRALALWLVGIYATTLGETRDVERNDGLRRVFEYIDEHLDSDLTLAEIARAGCLSVDNLKRLFRKSVGVSAHRYIVERRIAYATSLLKDGKSPLSEVAQRSGFYDQSHMTRWMRRVTGATPADVRAT